MLCRSMYMENTDEDVGKQNKQLCAKMMDVVSFEISKCLALFNLIIKSYFHETDMIRIRAARLQVFW